MVSFTDKDKYFTDIEYLSKNEIREKYNLENVDDIFNKVIEYRKLFKTNINLKADNGLSYFLIMSPSLYKLTFDLSSKLIFNYGKYQDLKQYQKNTLFGNVLADQLGFICKHYEIPYNKEKMIRIIHNKEVSDLNLNMINNYSKLEQELINLSNSKLDANFICSLNKNIIGSETNIEYNENQLNDFFEFFGADEDAPELILALITLYFFKLNRVFTYMNEETICLFIKQMLNCKSFNKFVFYLPFEYLIYDNNKILNQAFNNSLLSRDLTYFIRACLNFLSESFDELMNKYKEIYTVESIDEIKPVIPTLNIKETFDVNKDNVNSKEKAHSFDDKRITDLLEDYPSLHYVQAHFYLSHCTIGKFYTVDQFKLYESVSYETARTSMDYLAKLGFYSKGKVGKKFTYTPTPRNDNLNDVIDDKYTPEGF